MKFEVKSTGSDCEAEGKHGGYLVRVVAHGDVREDKCLVHVYLQKMSDYGKAPTTTEKLDTAGMTAVSVDDAFAKGFDLAEKTIDSFVNP